MMYGYNIKRNEHQISLLHEAVDALTSHTGYVDAPQRKAAVLAVAEGLIHHDVHHKSINVIPTRLIITDTQDEAIEITKQLRDLLNFSGSLVFAENSITTTPTSSGIINVVTVLHLYGIYSLRPPISSEVFVVSNSQLSELQEALGSSRKLSHVFWTGLVTMDEHTVYGPFSKLVNHDTTFYYVGVKRKSPPAIEAQACHHMT